MSKLSGSIDKPFLRSYRRIQVGDPRGIWIRDIQYTLNEEQPNRVTSRGGGESSSKEDSKKLVVRARCVKGCRHRVKRRVLWECSCGGGGDSVSVVRRIYEERSEERESEREGVASRRRRLHLVDFLRIFRKNTSAKSTIKLH